MHDPLARRPESCMQRHGQRLTLAERLIWQVEWVADCTRACVCATGPGKVNKVHHHLLDLVPDPPQGSVTSRRATAAGGIGDQAESLRTSRDQATKEQEAWNKVISWCCSMTTRHQAGYIAVDLEAVTWVANTQHAP